MEPQNREAADTQLKERGIPPLTDSNSEANGVQTSHSIQTTAQQLTDQALRFLSTASNETLGACLVGLGTTTYLVLGRVGLVLMGVVGGVVLHATWEGSAHDASKAVEERRRKETSLDVARRVLDWRHHDGSAEAEEDEDDEISTRLEVQPRKMSDFSAFRPETEAALNELTEAVIRDYVQ
jgi:hypothetical protein